MLTEEAAERMQVILFTCRERSFRHPGGTHIASGYKKALGPL